MAGLEPCANRQRHVRKAGLPELTGGVLTAFPAPAFVRSRRASKRSRRRDRNNAEHSNAFPNERRQTELEETMPLTTVARGRVFDWSHAVGRGAARGTGFNYVQCMCLD